MPPRRLGIALALVSLMTPLLALEGCGGGGGSSGTAGPGIQVTGTLGGGATLASRETGLRRLLSWLRPAQAYAAGTVIDNVIAVDTNGNFILATKSGSSFSLSLPQGKYYLIAFLSGTSVVATYQADPNVGTTGWTALPVSGASRDVDLGTVSIATPASGNTAAVGTTPPATVATTLGLAPGLSGVVGTWDAAMQRLTNIDVDGDGVFDFQQGRRYDMTLHYEFNPNSSFAAIQGVYGDASATTYSGYGYWFNVSGVSGLNWACATLTAPVAITSVGSASDPYNQSCGNVQSNTECYNSASGSGTSVNFYCGGGSATGNIATAPATPPAGTYVVKPDASHTYTFVGVSSQSIDATNLYNIYVPSVELTMTGSQVTGLAYRWYKHDPATGSWVQPGDAELSAIMGSITYELGEANWAGDPTADRLRGSLPVTGSGSVSVPAQSGFTAAALRVTYDDAFGYGYGFEWR